MAAEWTLLDAYLDGLTDEEARRGPFDEVTALAARSPTSINHGTQHRSEAAVLLTDAGVARRATSTSSTSRPVIET